MYGRNVSVFLILLVELLERASYYGMRSILILYVADTTGLEMSTNDITRYFTYLTTAMVLIELPLGVVTDFFLRQKRAIWVGGIFAVIGYLLLLLGALSAIVAGLIFIIIGTGLVSPNLSVLLGRLYLKEEQQRDNAFLWRVVFVNFGSFFGALGIGVIENRWGFQYALVGAAALSILSWLLFVGVKNKVNEVEENLPLASKSLNDESILDAENARTVAKPTTVFWLIISVAFISMLYSQAYELISVNYNEAMSVINNITIFEQEYPAVVLQIIPIVLSIVVSVFLAIAWYFRKGGNSINRVASGCLFMILALVLGYVVKNGWGEESAFHIVSPSIFISMSEILLLTTLSSYLTRLSDVRYSSTIYGFYGVVLYLGSQGLTEVNKMLGGQVNLLYFAVIIGGITALLFVFRKQITRLAGIS